MGKVAKRSAMKLRNAAELPVPGGRSVLFLVLILAFVVKTGQDAVSEWRDRFGLSCQSYRTMPSRCLSAAFYANDAGVSANEMCCACDGAPAGFACRGTETIACPAGYKCAGGNNEAECGEGTFCPTGSPTAKTCEAPAGRFCPARSSTEAGALCPAGFYCQGGSAAPLPCLVQPGFFCGVGSTAALPGISCPMGYWCPGACPESTSASASTQLQITTSAALATNVTFTTTSQTNLYISTTTTPAPSSNKTSSQIPTRIACSSTSSCSGNGQCDQQSGCECYPGWNGSACESKVCGATKIPCRAPVGLYCPPGLANESWAPCPPGKVCWGGVFGPETCPANTYANLTACDPCPLNTRSPAGSTGLVDCRCMEGYSGPDGGPCAVCAAGSFKTENGNLTCKACEAGTYGTLEASNQCEQCVKGKYSLPFISSTACNDCTVDAVTHWPEGACTCPPGEGLSFGGDASSVTLQFRDLERSCVSQRQGCNFYDMHPWFCRGTSLPKADGKVYVADFDSTLNCTDHKNLGKICAFPAQHGEMRCTQLSVGTRCARPKTPADSDALFTCCGCGGGLGIAQSRSFVLHPVQNLQMVLTGVALPGFLGSFFSMGALQPGFGVLASRNTVPYLASTFRPHIDFNVNQDFPPDLDSSIRDNWFQGRFTGIIDVVEAGRYNVTCVSTHPCWVWVNAKPVISESQARNATALAITTWAEVDLVEGSSYIMAEMGAFQFSHSRPSMYPRWHLAYRDVQPVNFAVRWYRHNKTNSSLLQGYHEMAKHQCSGKCTKCNTCPDGYRINGSMCSGTGFLDTQSDCVKCTSSCPPGHFLNASNAKCDGSDTIDRSCQPCKNCSNGEFIEPGSQCFGNTSTDTKICRNCTTQCAPGFYLRNLHGGSACNGTELHDNLCVKCAQCRAGQYRDDAWLPCNGSVNPYVDTQARCRNCSSKCGVGYRFLRGECTGFENDDRPCKACWNCAPGKYRTQEWLQCTGTGTEDTQNKCQTCSSCGSGEYRLIETHRKHVNGSFVRNASWSICDGTGSWDSQGECATCRASCPLGQRLTHPPCTGVEISDRNCTPCAFCEKGKYINSSVYKQCDGTSHLDTQNHCQSSPFAWHDKDGAQFNCTWYGQHDRCSRFGSREDLRNQGKTANEACCECGGGEKSCVPCKSCAIGKFISGVPCNGTTQDDLSSCQACTASCPNGTYLDTSERCDGQGFHDRQCRNCTRTCPHDQVLNTSLSACNGLETTDWFCQDNISNSKLMKKFWNDTTNFSWNETTNSSWSNITNTWLTTNCSIGEFLTTTLVPVCSPCGYGLDYQCGSGKYRTGSVCNGTGHFDTQTCASCFSQCIGSRRVYTHTPTLSSLTALISPTKTSLRSSPALRNATTVSNHIPGVGGQYIGGVCLGNSSSDTQTCEECRATCPEFMYISEPCTGVERQDRSCMNCTQCSPTQYIAGSKCDGTTTLDTTNCTDCQIRCGMHNWISKPCTGSTFSDIECSPCPERCGQGSRPTKRCNGSDLTPAHCVPCHRCPVGFYRGPSWAACDGDTVNDTQIDCVPCVSCGPGSYESPSFVKCEGTGYTDTQKGSCIACGQTCNAGEYRATLQHSIIEWAHCQETSTKSEDSSKTSSSVIGMYLIGSNAVTAGQWFDLRLNTSTGVSKTIALASLPTNAMRLFDGKRDLSEFGGSMTLGLVVRCRCHPCVPGTAKPNPGASSCTPCAPGMYSGGGLSQCQNCRNGTFSAEPASSACLSCSPWETSWAGQKKCIPKDEPGLSPFLVLFTFGSPMSPSDFTREAQALFRSALAVATGVDFMVVSITGIGGLRRIFDSLTNVGVRRAGSNVDVSIGADSAGTATAIANTDIGKINSEMAKVGLPGATLVSVVVAENPLYPKSKQSIGNSSNFTFWTQRAGPLQVVAWFSIGGAALVSMLCACVFSFLSQRYRQTQQSSGETKTVGGKAVTADTVVIDMKPIEGEATTTQNIGNDCSEDEEQDEDLNDPATEHKQAKSRTLRCAFCEQTVCAPVIDRSVKLHGMVLLKTLNGREGWILKIFEKQRMCAVALENGQTVTVPSRNIKCSGQKDRPTRLSQCEDDEESGMSLEAASLDHAEFALDKQAPADVCVTDPNLDGEVSSSTKTGSGPDRAVPRSGIEEASEAPVCPQLLDKTASSCAQCKVSPFASTKQFLRCAKCHSLDYCSIECQKKHWLATHKSACADLAHGSQESEPFEA